MLFCYKMPGLYPLWSKKAHPSGAMPAGSAKKSAGSREGGVPIATRLLHKKPPFSRLYRGYLFATDCHTKNRRSATKCYQNVIIK